MPDNNPIIDGRIRDLLADRSQMRQWVDCFGSPLNLTFPEIGVENARRWRDTVTAVYPNTDIRFSMKACKSDALAKAFTLAGLGLDVSSAQELTAALEAYACGDRISFTGPDKPSHDLAMCIVHGVGVNLDSACELKRFLDLQKMLSRKGRPVLRLRPAEQTESRFGFGAGDLLSAARDLKDAGTDIEGLSFHLSGYDSNARIRVAREALGLIREMRAHGIAVKSLSIGGGYLMRYLDEPMDSQTFEPENYWHNKSIEDTYPYAGKTCAEHQAASILDGILSDPESRETLLQNDIRLLLEPGRALLDQCGGTLFSVTGTKPTSCGANAAILEGMSFSLSETWFNSDFVPKPVLLSGRTSEPNNQHYVLVGRSCLERDIIRWRLEQFGSQPQPGDLFYFHNTAGYQMDSNESPFHRIPLPRKASIFFAGSTPACQLDSEVNIGSFTGL